MAKITVVRCQHCKGYIRSMFQMDEAAAKGAVITGNSQQCSRCGKVTSADKLEWIDESEEAN